ncbi:MAG: thioredoxin family protein [Rhodospirillaceae bacterium]|nr:thioredoxin family protein [Rhodospirillaceae bacterium]
MRLPRLLFAALAALGTLAALAAPGRAADPPAEPKLGDNGLYVQPWFLQSFLDLREDLDEATAKGKRFVIFWEQKGCPYCKETHLVNLAKPEIAGYIQQNFVVLQLDLWGARKVKDFDGEELSERDLARKYAIRFTPTMQFFPQKVEAAKKSGKDLEVARMPGYMRPYPFYVMFHYVRDGAYAEGPFRAYFKRKFDESVAKGGKEHTW